MGTFEVVIMLSVILGVLGLIALGISLYLLAVVVRLEKGIKKKDELLITQEKELKEQQEIIVGLRERLLRKEHALQEHVRTVLDLKALLSEKNQQIQKLELNRLEGIKKNNTSTNYPKQYQMPRKRAN